MLIQFFTQTLLIHYITVILELFPKPWPWEYHEYKMVFDLIAQTNLYSKDTIYREKEFTVNFQQYYEMVKQ